MSGEERTVRGVRYLKDAYGWIWREMLTTKPGEPRWTRTGFSTFEQLEALR